MFIVQKLYLEDEYPCWVEMSGQYQNAEDAFTKMFDMWDYQRGLSKRHVDLINSLQDLSVWERQNAAVVAAGLPPLPKPYVHRYVDPIDVAYWRVWQV